MKYTEAFPSKKGFYIHIMNEGTPYQFYTVWKGNTCFKQFNTVKGAERWIERQ